MENKSTPQPRHETTDVHTRPIWISVLLLAVFCAFIGLAILGMFKFLQQRSRETDRETTKTDVVNSVTTSQEQFPAPRLQVFPEVDLSTFRARENEELTQYGWIDKSAGVVRIPIERAMDLVAQRGLPVRGQPGAPAPYRTTLDLQKARPLENKTATPDQRP